MESKALSCRSLSSNLPAQPWLKIQREAEGSHRVLRAEAGTKRNDHSLARFAVPLGSELMQCSSLPAGILKGISKHEDWENPNGRMSFQGRPRQGRAFTLLLRELKATHSAALTTGAGNTRKTQADCKPL